MRERQGFVLIATLMIGMVILLLVLGAAVTGVIDRTVSSNQQRAGAAYYLAKAGLAEYKTNIYWNLVDYYKTYQTSWCEPPISGGIKDANGNVILPLDTWSADHALGGGHYRVRAALSDGYMVLTSEGYYGDGKSTVQLVATAGAGPSTAWDNAIFAEGPAAGSKAINGNVSIYGSVHIVKGDYQVSDTAFTTNGVAGVYNDYFGAGTAGTDVQTTTAFQKIVGASYAQSADLCTRLKVASGSVYLPGGNMALGATGHPIYSVNLGNGNVYNSKNGTKQISDWHNYTGLMDLKYPTSAGINSGYQGYDLSFPSLPTQFPNQPDRHGNPPLDVSANSNCGWLLQGTDYTLPPANASTSHTCSDTYGNAINWVENANGNGYHLQISGTVSFPGDSFVVNQNVTYSGKGSIQVGTGPTDASANITMDGATLTPLDQGGYPATDFLAFVTPGTIAVSNLGPGDFTAFSAYAGTDFAINKQGTIVGSVVAKTFDVGSQVPSIAYNTKIRLMADQLCLPGTPCASGTDSNPGIMSNISIERR